MTQIQIPDIPFPDAPQLQATPNLRGSRLAEQVQGTLNAVFQFAGQQVQSDTQKLRENMQVEAARLQTRRAQDKVEASDLALRELKLASQVKTVEHDNEQSEKYLGNLQALTELGVGAGTFTGAGAQEVQQWRQKYKSAFDASTQAVMLANHGRNSWTDASTRLATEINNNYNPKFPGVLNAMPAPAFARWLDKESQAFTDPYSRAAFRHAGMKEYASIARLDVEKQQEYATKVQIDGISESTRNRLYQAAIDTKNFTDGSELADILTEVMNKQATDSARLGVLPLKKEQIFNQILDDLGGLDSETLRRMAPGLKRDPSWGYLFTKPDADPKTNPEHLTPIDFIIEERTRAENTAEYTRLNRATSVYAGLIANALTPLTREQGQFLGQVSNQIAADIQSGVLPADHPLTTKLLGDLHQAKVKYHEKWKQVDEAISTQSQPGGATKDQRMRGWKNETLDEVYRANIEAGMSPDMAVAVSAQTLTNKVPDAAWGDINTMFDPQEGGDSIERGLTMLETLDDVDSTLRENIMGHPKFAAAKDVQLLWWVTRNASPEQRAEAIGFFSRMDARETLHKTVDVPGDTNLEKPADERVAAPTAATFGLQGKTEEETAIRRGVERAVATEFSSNEIPPFYRDHYINSYRYEYMKLKATSPPGTLPETLHKNAMSAAEERMASDFQKIRMPDGRESLVRAHQWELGSLMSRRAGRTAAVVEGTVQTFEHDLATLQESMPVGSTIHPDAAVRVAGEWYMPVMADKATMGNDDPSNAPIGFVYWNSMTGAAFVSGGTEFWDKRIARLKEEAASAPERRSFLGTLFGGPTAALRPTERSRQTKEALNEQIRRATEYRRKVATLEKSKHVSEDVIFDMAAEAMRTGENPPVGLNPWQGLYRDVLQTRADLFGTAAGLVGPQFDRLTSVGGVDAARGLGPGHPDSLEFRINEAARIEWLKRNDRLPHKDAAVDAELRDDYYVFVQDFATNTLGWDPEP